MLPCMAFSLVLEQEGAQLALAVVDEPGLIGKQLDAAVARLGVDGADALAFLLQCGKRLECRFGGSVVAHRRLVLDPDPRQAAEVGDRLSADGILGDQRHRRVVLQRGIVVIAAPFEGFADVLVGDESIDVEVAAGALQALQRVECRLRGLAELGLPGQVARLQAERAVEQVIDLSLDAGDLLDQFAVFFRLRRQQSIRLDRRAQIGDDDLGMLLRVVGVDQAAMEGRRVGLRAVEDLAGEAAVGEQICEGYEVGMRIDAVALQCRTGDLAPAR